MLFQCAVRMHLPVSCDQSWQKCVHRRGVWSIRWTPRWQSVLTRNFRWSRATKCSAWSVARHPFSMLWHLAWANIHKLRQGICRICKESKSQSCADANEGFVFMASRIVSAPQSLRLLRISLGPCVCASLFELEFHNYYAENRAGS